MEQESPGNAPAPIERRTLSTQVRDFLLVEIANGRLSAGTPVRELEIAKRLGTSQSPVREAFKELVAHGLLETRSHVGTRVRELDERALEDAVPVRATLEGLAARFAAPQIKLDPEPLVAAYERMLAVAATGDRLAYASTSTQFHREIVKATGNDSLLRAWNSLGIEILTNLTILTFDEPLMAAATTHEAIVDALVAGDGDRAAEVLIAHVSGYVPGYTASLPHDEHAAGQLNDSTS